MSNSVNFYEFIGFMTRPPASRPLTRYQPPHQPSVSGHEVWVSATTTVGLYGVYGCPDRAAIRYSRGLQNFPVGGPINDFLRLGGPNVKMNSIYLKYGE